MSKLNVDGIKDVLRDYGYLRSGDCDALIAEIDRLTKENEQLKKTLEDVRMLATYPMQD